MVRRDSGQDTMGREVSHLQSATKHPPLHLKRGVVVPPHSASSGISSEYFLSCFLRVPPHSTTSFGLLPVSPPSASSEKCHLIKACLEFK